MDLTNDIRSFIVSNFLFGRADQLTNDTSFLETGVIDSTGILELVSHLEATYSINIQDHEMLPENLDSVARIAAFVTHKRAQAA